jgi:putative ATPase
MIYAGEDPKFIARRIVICASEDVGNADPHALQVAMAAAQAVQFIGMPEGMFALSQATAYVACAPKSNACCTAISSALADVQKGAIKSIPAHLQDAHYKAAPALGRAQGYDYPHSHPGNFIPQQYLPDELADRVYYKPTENGVEKKIGESLRKLRPNRAYE